MSDLEQRLLNDYQRDFPLIARPFDRIADDLGSDTQTVLNELASLFEHGKVSRVGPVFKPNKLGVSTLAAMSIPPAQLDVVADQVNGFTEVNHNYEREHRFNLWFVAVSADQQQLAMALSAIENATGYAVMSLPLVKEYHIDLGFKLGGEKYQKSKPALNQQTEGHDFDPLQDGPLVAAIQAGLPLVERPYLTIAEQLGLAEQDVIQKISDLQDAGIIRRLGVIVRHHELGYRANAMVVWDIPDDQVDERGKQLSAQDDVTLCYQRPRKPDWPYNLFSMIHGKNRDEVVNYIERMAENLGLDNTPYDILFSLKRFKQRGAKYFDKERAAAS